MLQVGLVQGRASGSQSMVKLVLGLRLVVEKRNLHCCGPSTSSPGQGSPHLWAQYLGIRMTYQQLSGNGQKQKVSRRRDLGDRKEYSLWSGAEGPGKGL